jgi:hypothetical protein
MSDNTLADFGKKKALIDAPLDWTTLRLSEQARGLRFFRDADNNIVALPVVMFDPTATGSPVLPMGKMGISDPLSPNSYARVYGTPNTGYAAATLGLETNSLQMLYNNAIVGKELEPQRTPNKFKNIEGTTASGANTIWTPAGGKKFRLMGGIIVLSKDAACAGAEFIQLRDGGTQFFVIDISLGALVAIGACTIIPFNFPGNGYLSTAADNVLALYLNGTLTAGNVSISCWGTEE